jgi:hypothetical protein
MAAYLKSGWNISDHLQIVLFLVCIAMWIDVINSPPALPEIQKKVAAVGFNDDTLSDTEVFQLSIVAQKFQTYVLVTSVHIFILIIKASSLKFFNRAPLASEIDAAQKMNLHSNPISPHHFLPFFSDT